MLVVVLVTASNAMYDCDTLGRLTVLELYLSGGGSGGMCESLEFNASDDVRKPAITIFSDS